MNDLVAVTKEQMDLLKEFKGKENYKSQCDFLKSKGKFIVDLGDKPKLPTQDFIVQWVENEDFEADGYDIDSLKEEF